MDRTLCFHRRRAPPVDIGNPTILIAHPTGVVALGVRCMEGNLFKAGELYEKDSIADDCLPVDSALFT